MSTVKNANLVFIPFPVLSHLVAAVNIGNLLSERHPNLDVTILVMTPLTDTKIGSYTQNSAQSRLNFIHLPKPEQGFSDLSNDTKTFVFQYVERQKVVVREAMTRISSGSGKLAGIVMDILCGAMTDVATEFHIPSYLLYTSGPSSLGLLFHLQSLRDDMNHDLSTYNHPGVVMSVPTFANPVPCKLFAQLLDNEAGAFLTYIRKFRETKGIILNTFLELDTHAITSLSNSETIPPVFPVGPVLQLEAEVSEKHVEIMNWLDKQPDSSVVFLCFGSNNAFEEDQVKEIAKALENSGQRFLWSLRKPRPKGKMMQFPGEFEDLGEWLPEGFLERTCSVGRVIGWAPQMNVLSHIGIGGFVSHCGWNSTLESVWCGVPIATWPMDAEQHTNAFQLVKELEMAEEIKMDYRKDSGVLVDAETIEKAIRRLMDLESKIREKVRVMKEESRRAMLEGGSSNDYLGRFVETVMDNIS